MSEETTTEEQATTEQPATEAAEKTFTQAELDRVVSERLAREREKYSDYEAIKERAAQAEELSQKLTETSARAEAAELSALRTAVSAEHGVPVKHLTGSTEEELAAQAQELLEWRGTAAAVKRETNSSGNTGSSSGLSWSDRAAEKLRK